MKVLVIGANGLTGRRVVRLLRDGAHDPIAMIRDREQEPTFAEMAVPTALGDLEEPLDEVLEGMDAVVFAAGSGSKTGPDKTLSVDRDGAVRSMLAAEAVGVPRYLMLSSMRADPRAEGHPISHYLRAKGLADEYLRRSPLGWTIVRPGRLTDDAGTAKVSLARRLEPGGAISRDDVAAVLVACLDRPETVGKSFDLLAGEVPVDEALSKI